MCIKSRPRIYSCSTDKRHSNIASFLLVRQRKIEHMSIFEPFFQIPVQMWKGLKNIQILGPDYVFQNCAVNTGIRADVEHH